MSIEKEIKSKHEEMLDHLESIRVHYTLLKELLQQELTERDFKVLVYTKLITIEDKLIVKDNAIEILIAELMNKEIDKENE